MEQLMRADDLVLRDYREADLEDLFHLDEICFAEEFRFDRKSMRRFAAAQHAIPLVAEKKSGEIVGFVIAHLERTLRGERGYVVTLDVSVAWRRVGLATRLMREVERRAFTAGARRMELDVFTGNLGAIRFYERLGYERVGMRPWFYGVRVNAVSLDAFAYRKQLTAL
jgi:ribosomal-protein-alanine N-acetyltransferase